MPPRGKWLDTLDQLSESASEQQEKFAELLEGDFDYSFKKGEIVKGRVINVDSGKALIDIGAKTVAILPGKEVGERGVSPASILKQGEEYEFFVLREEDEEGQFTLSHRRVAQAYAWKRLEELQTSEETIECKVNSVVKGGLLVDIDGLRGFVPSSHIRLRETHEELVGQTLPFKVLALDQNRNNIILSHRKVMAEQMAGQRQEIFAQLQEGSTIEGEVVRLTDFGAFVDLGGVDGLLPLSQMSWRWVEHPSDVLAIGDKVKVEVIGVDAERQRVSLSIKTLQADPWEDLGDNLFQGSEVEGKVTRVKQFGAFVEIQTGVEALLPGQDLAYYEQNNGEPLEPGQTIKAFVSKFNLEERRISLTFQGTGAPV